MCDAGSGCNREYDCPNKAHTKCSCLLDYKIPVKELRWLYGQRKKCGEKSDMMMGTVDKIESERQNTANKRKRSETEAKLRKKNKLEEEEAILLEQQLHEMKVLCEEEVTSPSLSTDESFIFPTTLTKEEDDDANRVVDWLLNQKLGDLAHLVTCYLDRPAPKRNTMPVHNTARASLRYGVSPAATAAVASEYLKDLIASGILSSEMSYLACDPSKIERARKTVMEKAKDADKDSSSKTPIVGISYDGRKDKHTRAMVCDRYGNTRLRMIKEEHISVTSEPVGRYLNHFTPDKPIHPEKPAEKVAQGLYQILEEHDSIDSIMFLGGDSTNSNTGWKGGAHANLEKLVNHKFYWGVCNVHTHELPLRHAIRIIDGPTASDIGFTGEVCSLLSKVNEMPYDPNFKKMTGGEDLIYLPDDVLKTMSTDQKISYKLVKGVKAGVLPEELQDILCGTLNHARWLTTGQRIVYLCTRKHGLTGHNLWVLELLVKFCLEYYFKVYFELKVNHGIVDAPYHILTQLRILKTLPKKLRDAATFYIRTGAWYAHPECLLLSMLASSDSKDRKFAVHQIIKLRGGNEYGDMSVRPRVTPKINLSAKSLIKLIKWKPGQVAEPVFTCKLSKKEIQQFRDTPFQAPKFSANTQSTERCVKLVTEAAGAVAGPEARDGYIRARLHHIDGMPVFLTKKHILCTFNK